MEKLTPLKDRAEALQNQIYLIVKQVIDAADPEQLLKMGCPSDEYDPVSLRIAEAIAREHPRSVLELNNLLAFVWHFSFGIWGDAVQYDESFTRIAQELYPLLHNL